jgi:hypothetical protein
LLIVKYQISSKHNEDLGNFLKGVTPELALLECILKDEYNYQKLTDAKFVAIKIYGCQHELVDVAKYPFLICQWIFFPLRRSCISSFI